MGKTALLEFKETLTKPLATLPGDLCEKVILGIASDKHR